MTTYLFSLRIFCGSLNQFTFIFSTSFTLSVEKRNDNNENENGAAKKETKSGVAFCETHSHRVEFEAIFFCVGNWLCNIS